MTMRAPDTGVPSDDQPPPYAEGAEATGLSIPTRGVRNLSAGLSYHQVIDLISEALKSAWTAVEEDQLDDSSMLWTLSYQDVPPEDIESWASKEMQRYMTHLGNAIERWNRARVVYISDRALAGKQKVSDARVFERNDLVWLRNSASCEIALERVEKMSGGGVDLR